MMKFLLFCVAFLVLFYVCSGATYYKFSKIESCTSLDKNIVEIKTCATSLRTGVNLTFDIKKPLNKILVRFTYFYSELKGNFPLQIDSSVSQKRDGIYVLCQKEQQFDWCQFVKPNKKPLFDRMLLEVLKLVFPQLLHKCPHFGHYEIVNANIGRQYVEVYPVGYYRYNINFTDASNKKLGFLSFTMKVEND